MAAEDFDTESEYRKLERFVERSLGHFALGLVRGNFPPQRNEILNRLSTELEFSVISIGIEKKQTKNY